MKLLYLNNAKENKKVTPWTVACHGIFQARVLEWVPFPSPGDLPKPGIEPGSPGLQADALPSEPPGKPQRKNTYKRLK